MKRILFCILFCILSFAAFTQTKNIVFRENYSAENIRSLKTDLESENLDITEYNGEEILIEVSSNNQKLIPQIEIENSQLKIQKSEIIFNKGDNCTVFVYIPFNHQIFNFYLNTRYGTFSAENLTAQESIKIDCGESLSRISNLTCDSFTFTSTENQISINQLDCSYFEINLTSGLLDVNLKKAPLAASVCTIKNGNLTLSLPRNNSFEIQAYTHSGKFINNFTKTTQQTRDWKSYLNGDDGPVITLQSHSGDIILNP